MYCGNCGAANVRELECLRDVAAQAGLHALLKAILQAPDAA